MSDENENDNPYQPPSTRDEPLAKQDDDAPKAKLNPVHWLVPILGYAYVPAIFIVGYLARHTYLQGQYAISEELSNYALCLAILSIFLLPIYFIIIIFLGWRRHRQGTNTTGMKIYHGLSLVFPLMWFFFLLWLVDSGPWMA